MADKDFNIIRFGGINLELEGEFVITAGIKPNVNTFTTTYVEFKRLKDIDAPASLEFYFKAPGAVDGNGGAIEPLRWDNMKIVDVEIAEWNSTIDNKGTVFPVKYRLQIADVRHQFETPRGGRLVNGEINKLPFDSDTGKDANLNPLTNNLELVTLCIKAMGLDLIPPDSLKSSTAIKDIEWRGNHAPTELVKILDQLGYALIVKSQAAPFNTPCRIVKIGEDSGELPTTDAVVPGGMVIPSLDRRGKRVVFSSCPTPAMNTINVKTLDEQGFELVCPDKDGHWQPIAAAVKSFINVSPAALVQNHFLNLPQEQRALLATYLYRCLRLNAAKYPRVRLYRELHEQGKLSTNFQISAKIAIPQGDGVWAPSDDLVRLTPVLVLTPPGSGSIIVVRELIGTVTGTSSDPEADFKEIQSGEIKAKITIEAVEQEGGAGPWHTKYFFTGWDSNGQLDASAARTAMSLPDAVVVSRPDLQLLQVDGVDQNFEDLVSAVAGAKDRYLAKGGDSKLHVFRGFAKVNLSGKVNEIRMTQAPPVTKVKEQTWWLPQGHYLYPVKETNESAAAKEGFPNQGKSESQRLAQGVAGATQPAVPIMPEPRVIVGKGHGVVRIDSIKYGDGSALGGAKYYGTIMNGATTVGKDGKFHKLDGMTEGSNALIINLAESGTDTSHWALWGTTGGDASYANYEPVGTLDDGTVVVTVDVSNPHALFVVVLTNSSSGTDGDGSNPASWTYTATTLAGDKLGDNLSFQTGLSPRRDIGPQTPAKRGIGYFDFERKFVLLYAFELHLSEVECDP